MKTDLFVIASQGRTATTWLSAVLNTHPDIGCAHGREFPLAFRDEAEISVRDAKAELSGIERARRKTAQIAAGKTPSGDSVSDVDVDMKDDDSSWGTLGQRFERATLSEIIENGRSRSRKKALTLIHAINAYELHHRIKFEKFEGTIRSVNLLRHPITRIQSYRNEFNRNWLDGKSQIAKRLAEERNSEYCRFWLPICRELGANPDKTNDFLWIMAMCWIVHDFNDLEMDMVHLPFERIVGDPDYFYKFLRLLYGDEVNFSAAYFAEVRKMHPINVSSERTSAFEVFSNWESWQRNAFKLFLVENRLRQRYRPFEYSFDMVLDNDSFYV